MREVITQVYSYNELQPKAQAKARDWWQTTGMSHENWDEEVRTDFLEVAKILGVTVDKRSFPSKRGEVFELKLYYSLTGQSAGACFDGHYQYKKGCTKQIKEYAPQDKELHAIAEKLTATQRKHGFKISCRIASHPQCLFSSAMDMDYPDGLDIDRKELDKVGDAIRDLADWLHKQLQSLWTAINEDAFIAEELEAGEYEFLADGSYYRERKAPSA